jgi:hypothetical protein
MNIFDVQRKLRITSRIKDCNGILIKISLFKSREAFDPSRRARLTKKKKN